MMTVASVFTNVYQREICFFCGEETEKAAVLPVVFAHDAPLPRPVPLLVDACYGDRLDGVPALSEFGLIWEDRLGCVCTACLDALDPRSISCPSTASYRAAQQEHDRQVCQAHGWV